MRQAFIFVVLLLGCGERPSSNAAPAAAAPIPTSASPEARQSFEARVLATRQRAAQQVASRDPSLRAAAKMPAPVATPNGGVRIDLRGTARHVRTLERQPDGSYKQACQNAPEALKGRGAQ